MPLFRGRPLRVVAQARNTCSGRGRGIWYRLVQLIFGAAAQQSPFKLTTLVLMPQPSKVITSCNVSVFLSR